jgi:hypothetical protein
MGTALYLTYPEINIEGLTYEKIYLTSGNPFLLGLRRSLLSKNTNCHPCSGLTDIAEHQKGNNCSQKKLISHRYLHNMLVVIGICQQISFS